MPPNAVPKAGGKEKSKADVVKKQKLVEDKIFGLKNKNKSKNVQKYVQSLHQSVRNAGPKRRTENPKAAQKKKKEEEAAREKELSELFKVAISQPKVPVGVDPKSVVCEFFRHGQCAKGFKCKYSHDLRLISTAISVIQMKPWMNGIRRLSRKWWQPRGTSSSTTSLRKLCANISWMLEKK